METTGTETRATARILAETELQEILKICLQITKSVFSVKRKNLFSQEKVKVDPQKFELLKTLLERKNLFTAEEIADFDNAKVYMDIVRPVSQKFLASGL